MWQTGLLFAVLTAVTQHTQSSLDVTDSYTAAVVEYVSPSLPLLSADLVLEWNAAAYLRYITEAARNMVDIIVFPEGGLHGHNVNRFVQLPSPSERVAPCDSNTTYHSALVMLSCGARTSNLYVVVNLNEEYYNSSSNRTEYYNSNVVFDRNGTAIGRYRKFNPYGERVTKPSTPDHHVFETDFGVTFGMFICFDIEFLEPAITLARDYGIKHFVFPHCWISELPFLTALQAQWGWAYSLDVVLLAAGCNNPSSGGTGSGIYQGRHGPLQTFQTNSRSSKLLIANVSKTFDTNAEISSGVTIEVKDEHTEDTNSSLVMLRDYLDVYKTHPLLPVQQGLSEKNLDNSSLEISLKTETTICHNNFCCEFQVEMTTTFSATVVPGKEGHRRGDYYSDLQYRLMVFDGVRWYGGGLATGGIQVCGIVACVNDSVSSCGLRADHVDRQPRLYGQLYQTSTVFHRISITPAFLFNSTFIYPDIFLTGTGDDFGKLMPSSDFTFEEFGPYNNSLLCSLIIDTPVPDLITAAVYARQFDKDGQPRTELSSGYNSYNPNIFVFCILFIFIYLSCGNCPAHLGKQL